MLWTGDRQQQPGQRNDARGERASVLWTGAGRRSGSGRRLRLASAALLLLLPQLVAPGPAWGQASGAIRVSSTPAGGSVYLDGRPTRLTTPATLANVAPGPHSVIVVLHLLAAQQEVLVHSGKTARMKLHLATLPAALAVQSKPAGATVVLDGVAGGQTPVVFDLPAGPHQIQLLQEGFCPARLRVEVGEATEPLNVPLQPCVRLVVVTVPADAQVLVDGVPCGAGLVEQLLPPGKHEVAVEALGYRSWHRALDLVARQPAYLRAVLRPGAGVDEGEVAVHEAGAAHPALFWASLATAGAGAVATVTAFFLNREEQSEADDAYRRYNSTPPSEVYLRKSLQHDTEEHDKTAANWLTIAVVAGVATAGAGLATILLWPQPPPPAAGPTAELAPLRAGDAWGLGLLGRF